MKPGRVGSIAMLAAVAVLAGCASRQSVAQSATGGIERDGVVYTVSGPPESMDIALPAAAKQPSPVVVCIHGGGWTGGSRADMHGVLAMLQSSGIAACSIDYRLAPQYKFPAQIEDCACAVRYLRSHASELNIDPSRIGVLGLSAGAHLALLLALAPPSPAYEGDGGWSRFPSSVRCVVDIEGPTDLSAAFNGGAIPPSSRNIGEALFGAPVEDHRQEIVNASPVNHVKSGAPPVLIIQGGNDTLVPVAQSQELYDKLKAAGDDVAIKIVPGLGHRGLEQFGSPDNIALTTQFFSRNLSPRSR